MKRAHPFVLVMLATLGLAAEAPVGGVTSSEPVSRRAVVHRTTDYEVSWGRDGLWLQLFSDGVRDGPPFRIFHVGFWARDAGFAVQRSLQSAVIETSKAPARAASAEFRLRIRVEDERRSRVVLDTRFASNSVVLETSYRQSARDPSGSVRTSVFFSRAPGVPSRPISSIPNLPELCRDMAVELVLDDGNARTIRFWEDVTNHLNCTTWTVRGIWTNWVVRGSMDRRDALFRFWQYGGTKPAEGFGFAYLWGGKTFESRATIEWLPKGATAATPETVTPERARR
ncbi:MAG: hypothetical protein N2652_09995 [Kiritimatiellae bacterium]|nr:hypothetical protein [Kiritimatiellia bacterium]